MALKKNEKIMLGIVLPAAVIFGIIQFAGKKDKPAPKPPSRRSASANNADAKTNTPEKDLADLKPGEKVYFNEWARDPFNTTPKVTKAVKRKPKLDLKGVFWNQGRAYVMINEHVIAEGGEKGGIKIQKIEGNQIHVVTQGSLYVLNWKGTT